MDYEIRGVPAVAVEIFPVAFVAETKAMHDATVGGMTVHQPRFEGRLAGHKSDVLKAIRDGSLRVCDTYGNVCLYDEFIESQRAVGALVEVFKKPLLKKSTKSKSKAKLEPDRDETLLMNLMVSLKTLNEWGLHRGDHFTLSNAPVEWIDERGWVGGECAETVSSIQPATSRQTSQEGQVTPTKEKAAARHDRLLTEILRKLGYDPNDIPRERGGRGGFSQPKARALEMALTPEYTAHGFTRSTFMAAWQRLPKKLDEPPMAKLIPH